MGVFNFNRYVSMQIGNELRRFELVTRKVATSVSPSVTSIGGGILGGASISGAAIETMEEVFRESQAIVPVWSGALKASGEISNPVKRSAGEMEILIGYGHDESDVFYAAYVHEEPQSIRSSGQRKYLEQPFFDKVTAKLPRAMASTVASAFNEVMSMRTS
jgi:hypothetical protein